jgi:tetratricopeptide (TPR) repeat protein
MIRFQSLIRNYAIAFIIISTMACQTLKDPAGGEHSEAEVLASQKAVIVEYINQSQPQLALKDLRPLVRQHPSDPDLKNLLGLSYLAMKNAPMALTYFEKAYKLEKRASFALNMSSACIETQQYARAIKVLKDLKGSEAGKSYQFPERISHNIAFAAEKLQKLTVAEKYYKAAISENPYYYMSLMRLAGLYDSHRKPNLALPHFQKAHEACLKCYDPLQSIVRIQVANGRVDQAMKALKEYLTNRELDPEDRMKAKQLQVSTSNMKNKSRAQRAPGPVAPVAK